MSNRVSSNTVHGLLTALKHCKNLQLGKSIHVKAITSHYDSNKYVLTALIKMYSKCASMADARSVFDSIQEPDVVSWTVLILGYAENGEGLAALEMFSRMKARGFVPDAVTYIAALKACTSLNAVDGLERGRDIHSEVGQHMNLYVKNMLIDMYGKCGSIVDARRVFDSILTPNVISWNALLMGYAEDGQGLATLELFKKMKGRGYVPDSITYIAILKACTYLAVNEEDEKEHYLELGRNIHVEIGFQMDHYLQNALIDMYAKCCSMVEARQVFENMQKPNVVSWNSMIYGYADNGERLAALELFSKMKSQGYTPSSITYLAALKACGFIGSLALGRRLHAEIREFTSHVVTCLIDFYAKCGSIREAREVFDLHSRARCVPAWNALLAGYGSFGDSVSVFKLFEAMQDEGFKPDGVTFVCVLLCCSHAGLAEKSKAYVKKMPGQYGVFPDVIHYNCLVDVLGRTNQLREAVDVLGQMRCSSNSWKTLLGACKKWKNVDVGRLAFRSVVEMDRKDPSAYVLMGQLYGSVGMLKEQESLLEMRAKFRL